MSDETTALVATSAATVGPFFSFGLTTNTNLGRMVQPGAPGDRISLAVRILDGQGTPVPDAVVELWQASASEEFLFGRLGTDADGVCRFETVRPSIARATGGPAEAAHINMCLFMRGLLRHIYTRVYLPDDPVLASDPVLALVPADRRETLVAQPVPNSPEAFLFEVRLQGERETVFFDL